MSFKTIEPAPFRLNRSELAVPASNPKALAKAPLLNCDIVFLDLEDSVAPSEKEIARKNAIAAINEQDWGQKTLSVRINGLDTPYMYRDIIDVIERTGDRLDLLMIPKVGTAADVYAVDMLVTQVETAMGKRKRVGFELLIESALGLSNVETIAAASRRNESLHFGVADYAASIRARTTGIGGANALYGILSDPAAGGERHYHWGDPWHYALARLAVAARANGLRAVDGPFGDFKDSDGYRAQAGRAACLGCEGKWAIHPSQIADANDMFSPLAAEIDRARRIIAAMDAAERSGRGAAALDGRLIDYASIRQARTIVDMAEALERAPVPGAGSEPE